MGSIDLSAGNIIGALLILFFFPLIIYIYVKYDKEPKPGFSERYYSELPGRFTPSEAKKITYPQQMGCNCLTATLFDLVRKKQLIFLKDACANDGNKKGTDFCLLLNKTAPPADLKKHEAFVINWFIGIIGNGERVFFSQISDCGKRNDTYRQFRRNYEQWRNMVHSEVDSFNLFESSSKNGRIIGYVAGFGYMLLSFLLVFLSLAAPGISVVLLILSLVMITFAFRITKYTPAGIEQNRMWIGFKNYLEDFSCIDNGRLPPVDLWEHYLVHAVAFNNAERVTEQLSTAFRGADLQDAGLTFMSGYQDIHSFSIGFNLLVSNLNNTFRYLLHDSTNSPSRR